MVYCYCCNDLDRKLTDAVLLVPDAGEAALRGDVKQGGRGLGAETKTRTSSSFRLFATFGLREEFYMRARFWFDCHKQFNCLQDLNK